MQKHGCSSPAFQRRKDAVALTKAGWSAVAIGGKVGVSPRSVRRWKAVFRKHGVVGLQTKARSGRPCRLSHRQLWGLTRRVVRGARAQGFDTDLWTCRRIAQLIQTLYRVRYHVDHIPRLMAALGFSVQRPERQARERDDQAIHTWIARVWPRLKKRPHAAEEPSFSLTKPAFF